MNIFTVVDQAGQTRYEGTSLRDAYSIWQPIAIRREADMTDLHGNHITDMDCGGGDTLFWVFHDTEEPYTSGEAVTLMDTACGRSTCWDCADDHDMPHTA